VFTRWPLLLVGLLAASAVAQEPDGDAPAIDAEGSIDWSSLLEDGLTRGGMHFWSDELVYLDWRIQRNAVLGFCRLLDGEEHRHARGSFEQCREALDQIRRDQNLPPMTGKAVIVLHGLSGTRAGMAKLADYLRENGDYQVLALGYPSMLGEMREHAEALASVMRHLDDVEEIDFVAHSMGNIVLRHYLADELARTGGTLDPRIKRIVMLAPPNHGAEGLSDWADNDAARLIFGPAAQQLTTGWTDLEPKLATPPIEFGIIAGGFGDEGLNPKIPGDDDGVVALRSARLAGAADWLVVPRLHTNFGDEPKTQQCTLCFLEHGYFIDADRREPISADSSAGSETAP
jgi:pimeloyl-ACP methyl ester carboxylesterase